MRPAQWRPGGSHDGRVQVQVQEDRGPGRAARLFCPHQPIILSTELTFHRLVFSCVNMLLYQKAAKNYSWNLPCFKKQWDLWNFSYSFFHFFSSVALKYLPTLFWLSGFLSGDEGLLASWSGTVRAFLTERHPRWEKPWAILLTETAPSESLRGQGEIILVLLIFQNIVTFVVIGVLGRVGKWDIGCENSKPWIITWVCLTYRGQDKPLSV